jgi:hypothetical protein
MCSFKVRCNKNTTSDVYSFSTSARGNQVYTHSCTGVAKPTAKELMNKASARTAVEADPNGLEGKALQEQVRSLP